MLTQSKTLKYLDGSLQAKSPSDAIEEVLRAYALEKYRKGSSSSDAIEKLRLLAICCRATSRFEVLKRGDSAFGRVASNVALGEVAFPEPLTAEGKTAWAELTRSSDNANQRAPSNHANPPYTGWNDLRKAEGSLLPGHFASGNTRACASGACAGGAGTNGAMVGA